MFKKLCLSVAALLLLSSLTNALDIVVLPDGILSSTASESRLPITNANWQPYTGRVLSNDQPQWLLIKLNLNLKNDEVVHNPLALAVKVSGVYDFYWDDERVGSNIHKGINANLSSRVYIPVSNLTQGPHTVKMRIIPLGMETGDDLNLEVYPAAVKSDFFGVHLSVISTFFVATAALFTGFYLILIGRTSTTSPGIRAATIISFAVTALILLLEGKNLFSYPYSWQPIVEVLLPPLAVIIFLLLPWFVFSRLNLKSPLKWMTITPVIAALSFIDVDGTDHDIRTFGLLSITLLLIACYAWRHGHKAAKLYVAGFALSLIALWLDPNQKHLFLIVITLMMATELALDIRRRTAEATQQKLISERLRADLIKRNIRPHFLMNSLTALMEWVETDPDEAVEFIDGLADEFRMLDNYSEKGVITLREELRLCQTHLDLMARRLNSSFTLETSNVDTAASIPPGIFHTLVENTFSHNNLAGLNASFTLTRTVEPEQTTYVFHAPMGAPANNDAPSPVQKNHMGTGAGTRYILARLEEFCGKQFVLTDEPKGNHWQTTIQINHARL